MQHLCTELTDGCYRCELNKDEMEHIMGDMTPTKWLCEMDDLAAEANRVPMMASAIVNMTRPKPNKRAHFGLVDRSLLHSVDGYRYDLQRIMNGLRQIQEQMDAES